MGQISNDDFGDLLDTTEFVITKLDFSIFSTNFELRSKQFYLTILRIFFQLITPKL
jgi:hypothetical protein